jgi:hypothetical protein
MLSSNRSRALLAVLIAALLIGALMLYILYGEKKPHSRHPAKNTSDLVGKNESTPKLDTTFEGSGEAPTDSEDQIPLISDDDTISSTSSKPTTTTPFVPMDEKAKTGLLKCSIVSDASRPTCEVEKYV